jgi:hypothetical protein
VWNSSAISRFVKLPSLLFTEGVFYILNHENKVALDFSRSGKPTDNAFVKSFIGIFRHLDRVGNGGYGGEHPGHPLF